MDRFHVHEHNNQLWPEDTPDEQLHSNAIVPRRAAIKLAAGPKIMVVVPIGAKPLTTVLDCPQCKERGEEKHKFQLGEGFQPEGLVHFQFLLQHMNWLPPLNATISYAFKTGMLSAAAREVMTMDALKVPTVEYIYYVDDDMIIPPMGLHTLYNLMEQHPDWGAVSGVYSTRQDPLSR